MAIAPTPALANWTALPGAVQISTNPAYSRVRTARDGGTGLYIAWRDSLGSGANSTLYLQHLDGLGNYVWGFAKKISDGGYPAGLGDYMQMDVCPDGSGGVFVAYEDYFSDLSAHGTRTWLTRLDFSGATMSGFPVQLNIAYFQVSSATRPAVCSDGAGNAIVSWGDHAVAGEGCSGSPNGDPQLFAQEVDGTGHTLWTPGGVAVSRVGDLATDLDNEAAMRPAPCAGGGAYFTWTGFGSDCTKSVVRIQLLNAAGQPQLVSGGLLLLPLASAVAYAIANGTDCIETIIRGDGVFVERVRPDSSLAWYQLLDTSGAQGPGSAVSDELGGVLVTWWSKHANRQVVQDLDAGGALSMPTWDTATHGTAFASTFSADPNLVPPCVIPDHKRGAFIAVASTGSVPSLRQVRVQGVSLLGQPAFPNAGLTVSPAGQNALAISGVPGVLNNGMFAWGNSNGVWAQQISLSDLDATVTPPGWAGPLVPRSLDNSTPSVVAPSTLLEDSPTWVNWAVTQHGPNPTGAFRSVVYLDGFFVALADAADNSGPGLYYSLNRPTGYKLPGGPHTLALGTDTEYDPLRSVDETTEADDVYKGQWVWEPSYVLVGPSLDLPVGPIGGSPLPNGNSHKVHIPGPLTPAGAPNAWVVSDAARRGPTFGGPAGGVIGYGDSYGLQLYDAPAGVPEFTHIVDASHQPYNGTNFVLGLSSANPESLYTLQVRDSTQDTNPDSCWFDFQQADTRSGPVGSSWTNQAMAAGELADVYILNAVVRQTMRLTVRKQEKQPGPTGRLAFELFAPGSAATFHRGLGFGSFTHDADAETLTVVATRTGPYLAVVYRTDGTNAGTPLTYDFMTSSTQTLDAPVVPPRVLALRGATPNPASATRMTIAFELPSDAPARLEVVDVGGRRVLSRDVGGMGAGLHAVDLAKGGRIAPGVYWVRLTQGATSRISRVAVVD
ncbi:MAG TPA: T9SS type A sorting domain-containing protein [Actinomycetota bacterium]|nr:T9SS type A sorting domain-containing protein [Actinomycetota bacterium]